MWHEPGLPTSRVLGLGLTILVLAVPLFVCRKEISGSANYSTTECTRQARPSAAPILVATADAPDSVPGCLSSCAASLEPRSPTPATVGMLLSPCDGARVGSAVGIADGTADGAVLGPFDGARVGSAVGVVDGTKDGESDGASDGVSVLYLAASVGTSEGTTVGV